MKQNSESNNSISSMNDTMNDTILKDIRDHDENEICTSSPNIHERTLNSLEHEWSICDIFEINESETLFTEMHMSKNEQQNIKLIKRNSDSCSSIIPRKVCCLDNQNIEQGTSIHCKNLVNNDTFYGLPNKVKELFLQIRGINSLYRKYFNYKK